MSSLDAYYYADPPPYIGGRGPLLPRQPTPPSNPPAADPSPSASGQRRGCAILALPTPMRGQLGSGWSAPISRFTSTVPSGFTTKLSIFPSFIACSASCFVSTHAEQPLRGRV